MFLNFINVHWWIKFKFSVTKKIIYVYVNEMFKFVTENLSISIEKH